MILSAVFSLTNYQISISAALILLIFYNSRAFMEIDYKLLATFLFFFIAVGGFAQIPQVSSFIEEQLHTSHQTFTGSLILSQIISNVPAAILAAPFTVHSKALFFGVNIGGLGTIIASLANLIGFKIYKVYYPEENRNFLIRFSCLNGLFLAVFIFIFSFIL